MKNIYTLEQSSYALIRRAAMLQCGTSLQYGIFLHVGTYIATLDLLFIFMCLKNL